VVSRVTADAGVTLGRVKVVRPRWTSGSFLVYAGGLMGLGASIAWLQIISDDYGSGGFAGWTVLFWAIAELIALGLLVRGRRLAAGVAAFVGLGLWTVMLVALFEWWGWLPDQDRPIQGFHLGTLFLELLVVVAAIVDLRIWRHPLIVAILAPAAWLFVTDVVSSGGNWTWVVTLLVGFVFFFVGLGLDAGDRRPYGFWVHVTAGILVGAAFLNWWHTSDAEWAGIIIVALVFIFVAAALRRSSWAVLGVIGLIAATAHYAGEETVGDVVSGRGPTKWALPVAFLCLGGFLLVLGLLLHGRRDTQTPEPA
jgi:hypothetical protein